MEKQDVINLCLTLPDTYEDYPFDETTTLIRHTTNKKMFALIDHLHGKLQITLKCDPLKAEILRGAFESVIPGYHMNKKHWNTVYVEGDVPYDEIEDMIAHSYDLVKPRVRQSH